MKYYCQDVSLLCFLRNRFQVGLGQWRGSALHSGTRFEVYAQFSIMASYTRHVVAVEEAKDTKALFIRISQSVFQHRKATL